LTANNLSRAEREQAWEKETQEVLALAWCQLNKPIWEARREMQFYLEEHFELKRDNIVTTTIPNECMLGNKKVEVGDKLVLNGDTGTFEIIKVQRG
jgi:hypothetical protein